MKVAGGIAESGVVVGNTYDKYNSRNRIVRRIMQGFEQSLNELVLQTNPKDIHEVGCGEGYWVLKWLAEGRSAIGTDFSQQVIDLARANAADRQLSGSVFNTASVYDLLPQEHSADLIVCCEVLEHLEDPARAMSVLQTLAQSSIVLSVPREPIWSLLNMARGKYLPSFGNTPGHIQRWSKSEFLKFVSGYFDIADVRSPLPWTMVLCRPRKKMWC